MRRRLILLLPIVLLLAALSPVGSRAATPASGTLSFASPVVTWTNSGPMNGSAPAVTRDSCQVPTTCDDFALTIDAGGNDHAYVTLTLTPSGSIDSEEIILYTPDCTDTGPTSTCYTVYSNVVHMTAPKNGKYTVRTACTQCVNAGYSLTATIAPNPPTPHIPGAFDQSFGWKVNLMPGVDDKGTAPSSSGEPGIWINQHGKVIVNTFGPTIWISTDDGKTFSNANQNIDVGCSSGDADAVVSFDDAYYADNLCLAGGTNLNYTSRDDGKTWQAGGQGLPSLAGAPDSDRQWYAPDPKNAGVVYFAYHDLEGPNINVWKSTDYGQTFTRYAPVTLGGSTFVDSSQGNTTSRPWVDPIDTNTISMLYAYNDAVSSATTPPNAPQFNLREFGLARSTDGGQTWTNNLVYDAGSTNGQTNTIAHEFPQATMDSAGNIFVLFSEKIGGQTNTHIMLGVLPRGATTFTNVVQVDHGLLSGVFPWASAGDPGMVDITWYGSPAADNDDHNAQWSEMFAQTTNALSAHPTFVQSRVSGSLPMHSADICLAGTLCLVTGGNRNLADFQGVAVDPCGYAEAVWDDDNAGGGSTMFARQTGGSTIRPSAGCGAQTASGGVLGQTASSGSGTHAGSGSGTAPIGLVNTAASPARPVAAFAGLVVLAAVAGLGRRRRRNH
jgi:hypothetical protein